MIEEEIVYFERTQGGSKICVRFKLGVLSVLLNL